MSDVKWTPAPWWIEPETGDIVAKDGDWEICTFSRSDNNWQADSHLIAAAPGLYEALEELIEMCERQPDFNDDLDGMQIERCKAALAKARGE